MRSGQQLNALACLWAPIGGLLGLRGPLGMRPLREEAALLGPMPPVTCIAPLPRYRYVAWGGGGGGGASS